MRFRESSLVFLGHERRGTSFEFHREVTEDSPDFHKYHLDMESKFKPKGWKGSRGS